MVAIVVVVVQCLGIVRYDDADAKDKVCLKLSLYITYESCNSLDVFGAIKIGLKTSSSGSTDSV